MISSFISKAKGFLLDPVNTFRQAKEDEPGAVLPYFAVLLLLHAALSALLAAAMVVNMPVPGMTGSSGAVAIFFIILVGGFIGTLLFGAWLHLFVYILGGRHGIWQTLKAVMYGHTPFLILGWIPFVGFLFALWSLALGILGVRELHEISTLRAILAVAVAVLIPVILLILLAAYLMIAYVTTSTGPVPVPVPV